MSDSDTASDSPESVFPTFVLPPLPFLDYMAKRLAKIRRKIRARRRLIYVQKFVNMISYTIYLARNANLERSRRYRRNLTFKGNILGI